jgi:hypothetical protein
LSDDEIRGDRSDPSIALQVELGKTLDRYAEVLATDPGYVAALLIEYADTIRHANDLEVEVGRLADGMYLAEIEGNAAWLGVPREGEYGDLDLEALDDQLDAEVEGGEIVAEEVDLVDLDEIEEGEA